MERNIESMKSLKSVLSDLKVIKIQGIVAEMIEGRDADSTVFVLELDSPIARISSSLQYDVDGVKQKLVLEDVDVVKVHQSSLPEGFLYNPDTQEFAYEGDELKKDISGTGDAWLVSKSFAELNREGSTKRQAERSALRKQKFLTGVKAGD